MFSTVLRFLTDLFIVNIITTPSLLSHNSNVIQAHIVFLLIFHNVTIGYL